VLSGGEIAAMALIDACVRLLPGVMGKLCLRGRGEFSDGLLEYPQFTRPQEFEGRPIPEILLIGGPRPGRGLAAGRSRGPDQGAAA
jgi:tRNA (guanine37-N1)-methyltransferase